MGNHGNPGAGSDSLRPRRQDSCALSTTGSAREAIEELVKLFPRGLFEDALPPIALRSQVYSLVPDRTVADLQLVRSVPSLPAASRALAKSLSLRHSVDRPVLQQALGQGGWQSKSQGFGTAGRWVSHHTGFHLTGDEHGQRRTEGQR